MLKLNANTRIAEILKSHPGALDAIVSISDRFVKLRNPVLRKLMAGRTSLAMASKIGNCSLNDFYDKLVPLGFETEISVKTTGSPSPIGQTGPLTGIPGSDIVELDVRPLFEADKDPLPVIMDKISLLKQGQVLRLVSGFEPAPLISLLRKKGFLAHVCVSDSNTVVTWFYRNELPKPAIGGEEATGGNWQEAYERFKDKLETIDVRQMEMPKPMLTILDILDNLTAGKALLVQHKRVPVFLLPELAERKFFYRYKEFGPGDVRLLIFKN